MKARAVRWIAGLLLVAACNKEESPWDPFNADGESVEVQVTATEDLGAPVQTDLHSTTGAVVVGVATVNPGSGPVGTDHDVTVELDDAYESDIGRVTVETDALDRGIEEHELVQDSADHGRWWRMLTSSGTEGEERTDVFTFHVWTPVESTTDTDGAESQ